MSSFHVALQPEEELFCLTGFDFDDAPVFRGIVSKRTASLRHLLSKPKQSGNNRKRAAVMRPRNPAITKSENLLDPTNFVRAPTNDSAHDCVVTDGLV